MKNKNKIAAITVAGAMLFSVLAYNTPKAYAQTAEPIETTKEVKDAEFSYSKDDFKTKEEAEKWVEEKENILKDEYEITKKEVGELKDQIIGTEKVEVNETFEDENSAKERQEEIEKGDIKDSNLTITKEEKEPVEVNETFTNKEQAYEYIKHYKDKYNTDLSVNEIYSKWTSSEKIKYEELKGLTEAERDSKIATIVAEIKNRETDKVKYEVIVTKTDNTERVYVKDEVTKDSKTFDTITKAEEFIKNLQLQESDKIKIIITGPTLNKVLEKEETTSINKTFDSMEELNSYLENLKKEGFTLTNIETKSKDEIKIVEVPTGNVIVNSSNKLDSNNRYEVEANYVMIKQSSGNIAIWTEKELTESEKASFKEGWFNLGKDPSIGKDVNVYFIFGEGAKDLSYIGNQWGTYNFEVENGKIIMTCDKKRISHLNYGDFAKEYKKEEQKVTRYEVTGEKTEKIYKDEYFVGYEKTEKIYEDKTTYGALVELNKLVRDVSYNVTGTYSEKPVWNLTGEYEKNIRGSLYYGLIEANEKLKDYETEPEKEKTEDKKQEKEQVKEDSPETGDEKNIALASLVATTSLAGIALTRKRKYNK